MSSQSNKGLSTKEQIKQSKELITRHPNEGDITEFNKKVSNANGCFSLRNNLFFWINKKQVCASWCTAEAELRERRESFSKQMLKEYNVKQDVMTLHGENINFITYLIQHGWNKNLDSPNQLIKNLIEGKVLTLEHMGNKEQLSGCFVEGNVLRNAFRWKETVGPWENRLGHYGDVWNYWTDDGFGFYEGLQLAEDLKALPIWVFNNGISHSEQANISNIFPYVQDALDGIEFARRSPTSRWGSVRASMGHPTPFDLRYVIVGNEDCENKLIPIYKGSYHLFYDAIRNAYPDIQIISNCDASHKALDHPADLYDYHVRSNIQQFKQFK
ncbi:alpha-L-arabinofuranosidase 2-like [Vicia villosa]|uniref:alpha-L-arabinofuranosidase 2-like n=1 Tax=Vicia villosa TaxID=3911 RepID=UPI00273B6D93|nr:alpha-L-arabinofuranosidase 2-like [Vicia villosa]